MTDVAEPESRRDEIAVNLAAVRSRVADAARSAGRDPDEVTLTVVTKFFPASDVRILAELGVRDVGENRHQEAADKAADCADLDLRWHYVGSLQSNKAAAVAAYADLVESVDRAKLVAGLGRGAAQRGRPLDCLVQVSLDPPGASGRSGVDVAELPDLAARLVDHPHLRLRGLMAVAPLGEEPDRAFSRLDEVRARFLTEHPAADWLSAGMSNDLESAISHGATHVRIGRAVLGERPVIK